MTDRKKVKDLTPKQAVKLKHRDAHLSMDCGKFNIGSERLGVLGEGYTPAEAWADAYRNLQ